MKLIAKPARVNRVVVGRDAEGMPDRSAELLGSPPELPHVTFEVAADRKGFVYHAAPTGVLRTVAGRAELVEALRRDLPGLWNYLTGHHCQDDLPAVEQHLTELLVDADRAQAEIAVTLEFPPRMSLHEAEVISTGVERACNTIGRRVAAVAAGAMLRALAAEALSR